MLEESRLRRFRADKQLAIVLRAFHGQDESFVEVDLKQELFTGKRRHARQTAVEPSGSDDLCAQACAYS